MQLTALTVMSNRLLVIESTGIYLHGATGGQFLIRATVLLPPHHRGRRRSSHLVKQPPFNPNIF